MNRFFDRLFGGNLESETDQYLRELAGCPMRASHRQATELLSRLRAEPGPKVKLGETFWGDPVIVPLEEIIKGCGFVSGGMGTGKSMFASVIIDALIHALPQLSGVGFAIFDGKGELYLRTLFQLMEHLDRLSSENPTEAEELRQRIVIYDFGSRDPISSYNLLARWPGVEPDFFASNRADLLLDLLPGSEKLSLGASALLQRSILLLSEFNLPITYVSALLHDDRFRRKLLAKTRNDFASTAFARQLSEIPKSTLAALSRRIDALTVSDSIRLALSGNTAPDFRRFQDQQKIVLVNCFGENISRGVRRLLQGLVLSDIRQSVFSRRVKDHPYIWICDEAQNFFLTEGFRDSMTDLLTMSRSFGSSFILLTQNISTAVQDPRLLKILHTIVRWSFSMRSEPGDCAFLRPVLPVHGRKSRPQANPFREKDYYSLAEERAIVLDAMTHLADRVGYLWLRTHSAEAIKVKTCVLEMPQGQALERAVQRINADPTIAYRSSRKEYDRHIAERDREWLANERIELNVSLDEVYRRRRNAGLESHE